MMLAKSFLFLAAVWTFKVKAVVPSSLEEMIEMNPPMNIQISSGKFGEYTVSWDGNCTFEEHIYYQLEYKYLNSSDNEFNRILVQQHQKKMDLELHRKLFIRVKLLYDDDNIEISSNWTEKIFDLPRDSFVSVDNLTCIFYGNTYMNCTWDVNENAPEDAQYALSYRQQHTIDIHNCTNYRTDGKRNIGCFGHKCDIELLPNLIVCISELSNKIKLPFCRRLEPYSFYKLDNPINVTINKSTDEVTWKLPEVIYNSVCYKFQLNITNWNDGVNKVVNVTSTKYVISRDQTKRYSVQARALVNHNCWESTIWSDWSKPLIIASDANDISSLMVAAVVAVIFVALILLLVFICIKCKLLSKVCQPIPDAGEKFKGLFEECNGDFQKWINKAPQLTTKAEECILVTIKEV